MNSATGNYRRCERTSSPITHTYTKKPVRGDGRGRDAEGTEGGGGRGAERARKSRFDANCSKRRSSNNRSQNHTRQELRCAGGRDTSEKSEGGARSPAAARGLRVCLRGSLQCRVVSSSPPSFCESFSPFALPHAPACRSRAWWLVVVPAAAAEEEEEGGGARGVQGGAQRQRKRKRRKERQTKQKDAQPIDKHVSRSEDQNTIICTHNGLC